MPNNLKDTRDLSIYTASNNNCCKDKLDSYKTGDLVVFMTKCAKCFELPIQPEQVFTVYKVIVCDGWTTIELKEIPGKHFAAIMLSKKPE